jgi:hypothetical protein
LRTLLAKSGLVERRSNDRYPARNICAFYWNGVEQKALKIKDVSATGFFFLTNEPWLPRTRVSVVLHSGDFTDSVEPRQVCLRSRVVRSTVDGFGVTFVPESMEPIDWLKLVDELSEMHDGHDIVQLLRATSAIAFLCNLCPNVRSQLVRMFAHEFIGERLRRVIDISLKTQEALISRKAITRMDVPADVILRALNDGSQTDDEQTQHYWIGLLSTAAEIGGNDQETFDFLAILSQMIPSQVRIFTVACLNAIDVGRKAGFVHSEPLTSTIQSIRAVTRTSNLAVIERDLLHLNQLGIFENAESSTGWAKIDRFDTTPTQVGLKFYARCCGHRELEELEVDPDLPSAALAS